MGGQASTISRDPDETTKWKLRKEVGFGCPFPGCRKPFLSWHHFDPPWRVRNHHDPKGMIALCREHHDQADAGQFETAFLRGLKEKSYDLVEVQALFPWTRARQLYRIGRAYIGGMPFQITIGHEREKLIEVQFNEEGMFELSFTLKSDDGQILASMERNSFHAIPKRLHDLRSDTGASYVKIHKRKRDITLELKHARMTPDQLSQFLRSDGEAATPKPLEPRKKSKIESINININIPVIHEFRIGSLPRPSPHGTGAHDDLLSALSKPIVVPSRGGIVTNKRTIERDGQTLHVAETRMLADAGNPTDTASRILAWAMKNCVDGDGLVSILDFKNATFFFKGEKIVFKDSIRSPNASLGMTASLYDA